MQKPWKRSFSDAALGVGGVSFDVSLNAPWTTLDKGKQLANVKEKAKIKFLSEEHGWIFQAGSVWWCCRKVFYLPIFPGGRKLGRIDSCKGIERDYGFNSHLLALVWSWERVCSFRGAIPKDWSPDLQPELLCSHCKDHENIWDQTTAWKAMGALNGRKMEYVHELDLALKCRLLKVPSWWHNPSDI